MLGTSNDKWSPTKKLLAVMEKIFSLMVVPNLDSPLNQQASQDYQNNTWAGKAKQWT